MKRETHRPGRATRSELCPVRVYRSNTVTSAIQGLFSGSVMQYFLSNRAAFDDADAHGGLFLLSTEMCPFAVFEDFGVSMDTLDKIRI